MLNFVVTKSKNNDEYQKLLNYTHFIRIHNKKVIEHVLISTNASPPLVWINPTPLLF